MKELGWVEGDGVALRYAHRRGKGPLYVLLHEMGGSLESWDEVATALQAGGGEVLTYDQRGFGLSEKPTGPMHIDQHVADLLCLLDRLGLDRPVVLAGVAVGAGIAMAFAARHPRRVGRLLALAPACGVAPERQAGALEAAQAIAEQGLRQAAAGLFDTAYPDALRADLPRYRQYRSAWLSGDARALAALYRMLATQNLDADLARLPAETLVVGGSYDPLRPQAEMQRIAALCPQATHLSVPSGHFMQVNSPQLVAYLLREFAQQPATIAAACTHYLAQAEHRVGAQGPAR